MANLSRTVRTKEVDHVFRPFGHIDQLEVVRDPFTKESRGFAFVTYEKVEDACEAVRKLDGNARIGDR